MTGSKNCLKRSGKIIPRNNKCLCAETQAATKPVPSKRHRLFAWRHNKTQKPRPAATFRGYQFPGVLQITWRASINVIELVFADLNGIVLFHVLADQLIQNAGIAQLGLEILQAFIVLHVGTGQNTLPAGSAAQCGNALCICSRAEPGTCPY